MASIPDKHPEPSSITRSFPIVGIGASAGGLEALEEFFKHISPDTGAAFVVISHQGPDHVSLLPELLGKCSAMPSIPAEDNLEVQPNHIYVNIPGNDIRLNSGRFTLFPNKTRGVPPLPIDSFLSSLASERKENAVCVILSGTANDGTLGLKEINANTGLTVVQDPLTAKYPGMPESAIATGLVDYILSPKDMAAPIEMYLEHVSQTVQREGSRFSAPFIEKVLEKLLSTSGHDFSQYKRNMIERRVFRRMAITHHSSTQGYLKLLSSDPKEGPQLMKELLISVTNFFRDPEAFEAFSTSALYPFLEKLPPGSQIRAWCPGCATGEEAYSLAILLTELSTTLGKRFALQVFGTDLDRNAIGIARRGVYPETINTDIAPERLSNFFDHDNHSYRLKTSIRERIIFAEQDVIKDPPFTRLDIIVCRNLLIYLDSALQKRLLSMFHYALKPNGILFLGTSEAMNGLTGLFKVVDKRWRIFVKKDGLSTYSLPLRFSEAVSPAPMSANVLTAAQPIPILDISPDIERMLAATFAPPSAVVNDAGDILYLHGRLGFVLEPAAGKQPNNNILKMAKDGVAIPLAAALRQIAVDHEDITLEDIGPTGVNESIRFNIVLSKLRAPTALEDLTLIVFHPIVPKGTESENVQLSKTDVTIAGRIIQVQNELRFTQDSLRDNVSQLQVSNEELQSANEELQSSNEELETSREELQSLNEELNTVNVELETKVEQLSQSRDDMQNLLDGIDIATIFLDRSLNIRRYTRPATSLINLLQSDIGRPISDLSLNLNYEGLVPDLREVLHSLISKEVEVTARDGTWCLMRITPYRTKEKAIDGLVITFVDIAKLKESHHQGIKI